MSASRVWLDQCTELRFASFLSGGFITANLVNPPEMKLAKRTSVQWYKDQNSPFDNRFGHGGLTYCYSNLSRPGVTLQHVIFAD